MKRSEVGKLGEDLACGYLVDKGYQIIDRNLSTKFGELDIIAKSPDRTLVFIEVKTTSLGDWPVDKSPASYPHLAGNEADSFMPEDHMSQSKIVKFKKMSQWFSNQHPKLTENKGFRLDVIAITLGPDKEVLELNHYQSI